MAGAAIILGSVNLAFLVTACTSYFLIFSTFTGYRTGATYSWLIGGILHLLASLLAGILLLQVRMHCKSLYLLASALPVPRCI